LLRATALLLTAVLLGACSSEKSTQSNPPSEYEELFIELYNPQSGEAYSAIVADSADIVANFTAGTRDSLAFVINSLDNAVVLPDSLVLTQMNLSLRCDYINFIRGTDSSLTAMGFICLPDGATFNDSLILDIDPAYFDNNQNSNVVKLYIYNESNGHWNVVNALQKNNPRLRFNIGHFSRYAISD